MLCHLCKQNVATVFTTQMGEGKIKKIDVCESCYKAKGGDDPTGFSLADLLLGLGAAQEMEHASAELKCGSCGFTQVEFKKTGRLGCSECYATFAEGLEGLLKTMHRGTRHVGKVPNERKQVQDSLEKLKSLQKQLDIAIKAEDFEQAANIRDAINEAKPKSDEVPVTQTP